MRSGDRRVIKGESIMTIGEIAEKMDISVDTLRYYERIGVLPPVPRKSNGIRVYDVSYFEWVALVKELKASGMSLEEVIDYIALAREGEDTCEARKQLLVDTSHAIARKIIELQLVMRQADEQLKHYEKELLPKTEKLMQYFGNRTSAVG